MTKKRITSPEEVVLVDEQDNEIGRLEKMEAHRSGALHRAFSVFIFNEDGQLLLQRRAEGKYHSAGLWTNTCCSHQRPGEETISAAERRLQEEMGIQASLYEVFSFTYRAELSEGLIEHEYDHVVFGEFSGIPDPDPGEVSGWKYLSLDKISDELQQKPEHYTSWFKICFNQVIDHFNNSKRKVS